MRSSARIKIGTESALRLCGLRPLYGKVIATEIEAKCMCAMIEGIVADEYEPLQ